MAFCPGCGKEVPAGAQFCPLCGFDLKSPLSSPLPALKRIDKELGNHPAFGYASLLTGCAVIFILAVLFFAFGNGVAGGLGLVFAIAGAFFGQRAPRAKERTIDDAIPMLIGLVLMLLTGIFWFGFYVNVAIILGAFLMLLGSVMVSGSPLRYK